MIDQMIAAPLAAALTARGYEKLTAVQQAVLAEDAQGRDVLVSAQTGSGKTVAFGLAMAPEILAGDSLVPAAAPLALAVVLFDVAHPGVRDIGMRDFCRRLRG